MAVLSKLYAREGQKQKQEIIVNSKIRVNEGWTYDNWNGGTYGHALYFVVPEVLYLALARQREDLQNQIREEINNVHNVQNESIAAVFFEMEETEAEDRDWRKESGLLISGERFVLPEAEKRIWGNQGFRLFLSHKAEVKKKATDLKTRLEQFGVSCFVAHEDIHPTKEWQDEIENALFSMDAFLALMTDRFHDSDWTDQEVGVAFGRGVPIVSFKLGKDPYGFIGKFQALSCSWDAVPKEIVKIFIKHDRMLKAYVNAVQNCGSFDDGNTLAEILPLVDKLSEEQVNGLVSAYNDQVRGSFGFNGSKPRYHGDGLASHLSRLTGQTYKMLPSGKIKVKS
jgi:hypothetical protein